MTIPKSRAEADQLLHRKCRIEAELARIESRMQDAITRARQDAKARSEPLGKENGSIDRALKAWFAVERKHLDGQRVLTLTFGRIGARARQAVAFIRGWTEEAAVEALLASPFADRFVRVQACLNRQAIHDAAPEEVQRLADFGVRVEESDTLFVEANLDALEKEAQ